MNRLSRWIFAILSIAVCIRSSAQTTAPATKPAIVVTPPPKETFDIYLLMGQSNMVGRDTSANGALPDDPHIVSLSPDGKWIVARNPLHTDARIAPGAGPGMTFAIEMLKASPGRTIGLVPTAVGGTPLRRWVKGADLYENAITQAKIASQFGVIKGMIWHQGESDTNTPENASTYEARLSQMFKDLRSDLATPNLPIVVGQLGEFLTVEKYPQINAVRNTIRHMPDVLPHVGYADAAGLKDKGDSLHFNAISQAEFGTRYAAAMLALQKLPPGNTPTTQASAVQIHIAKFRGDRAGAISYTFDDNLRDQYTLILPMLKETGVKGTFFVIAGKTAETPEEGAKKQQDPNVRGKWGGISWPELKEIAAQGHEIASHTWSHAGLTKLSPEELDAELSKAYDSILSHIGQPPLTLAFPGNGSNAAVQAAALKYHVAYRSFQDATTDKSTVASLNKWADESIEQKKWNVMMTHALVDGYAQMSDPEIFHTHLKYAKTLQDKVWIDTFANVARYEKERDDAKITIVSSTPNSVIFTLTSSLDSAKFNVPLTVVLDAPSSASARRADQTLSTLIAASGLQIDTVPGGGEIKVEWK